MSFGRVNLIVIKGSYLWWSGDLFVKSLNNYIISLGLISKFVMDGFL